ncbi:MAG: prolyl oligopeptidase family serine peptidase [Planctomycetota bacterium]|nr:prolyl oligopeptidase family serine peptidase [Planctomycetota bacterium]
MPKPAPNRPATGPFETPRGIRNPHPLMVTDDYVARVRAMRRERKARLAEVRTAREARRYQNRAQEAIDRAFSPRPPKTPLKARVTGATEARGFRVENVLYESRPGILVTANLYVPDGCDARRPCPGVLGPCGHSANGKSAAIYQRFAQRLALAGFVTLVYDPYNQGERDQYWGLEDDFARKIRAGCCLAHNMMGKQLELLGEFFGMWRAWDGIRGLDYLLTRPEVDPTRLGVTGNSGGGTMTSWLWAAEPRFTMAAPSCFITSFASNLENEMPADNEQYPPGVIGAGLEEIDLLIARAPKPLLLLGQHLDFFDRRGLKEGYAELRRFYELLGAPASHHGLFFGPDGHGYTWHNQHDMVRFFHRHAYGRGKPPQVPDAELPDLGEKLLATPKGNTIAAGATPIYARIAELARAQDAARRNKGAPGAKALAKTVRRTLDLDGEAGTRAGRKRPPHFRALRPALYGAVRAACFAVETESPERDADARLRAFLFQPRATQGHTLDLEPRAALWLPHISAEAELNDPRLAGALLKRGGLLALDARGLGMSMPAEGDFFHGYGMDYLHHGHGLLLGRSYLGRRVHDVLRVLDLLASEGVEELELFGRGQGALLAAYAALLCPDLVTRVTLRHAPISYLEWATAPLVGWPAANMPRGVLKRFDLPAVYRALRGRLNLVEHWDARCRTVKRRAAGTGAVKLPRRRAAVAG